MSNPQTNPLSYNAYVTQIGVMAVAATQTVAGVVEGVDPPFTALIPQMLNYAELRIQRDIDLLPSQQTGTFTLTPNNPILEIDVDDFVTIQTIQVTSGTAKIPLLPVTKEYLQNVYNDTAFTGMPKFFAMYGGDSPGGNLYNYLLFGPTPDAAYPLTVKGTKRLPSLYKFAVAGDADTQYTFISTYLPDLLVQASMIYISQFQRNFGPTANDPEMGPSYEMQYQTLLKSAIVEEARKKFHASAWSSMSPAVAASPDR